MAIKGNVKKLSMEPTENTKYDLVTFLQTIENGKKVLLFNEISKPKQKKNKSVKSIRDRVEVFEPHFLRS